MNPSIPGSFVLGKTYSEHYILLRLRYNVERQTVVAIKQQC